MRLSQQVHAKFPNLAWTSCSFASICVLQKLRCCKQLQVLRFWAHVRPSPLFLCPNSRYCHQCLDSPCSTHPYLDLFHVDGFLWFHLNCSIPGWLFHVAYVVPLQRPYSTHPVRSYSDRSGHGLALQYQSFPNIPAILRCWSNFNSKSSIQKSDCDRTPRYIDYCKSKPAQQ